jgi:DNA-binding CsgD family transcriptional regulator
LFNDIIMQDTAQLVKTFVFQNLPKITPKERLVLLDLLKGVPLQCLGEAHGMTANAAKNHLARLRDKFEVKRTEQLKHKLETLNILDYL